MLDAAYSVFNRRHFLKHLAGLSAVAVSGSYFVQQLRAAAPQMKKQGKSLIILWMNGGPPTIDLWDMKPGQSTGGELKPAKTSVSGIEICELLPTVAKQMKNLSIIRSLVTNEGDHNRGRMYMHTGRVPSPVVNYPSMGSVASYSLTPKDLALPGFISIGRPAEGPGFLGMNYAPFTIQNPGQPPENVKPPDSLGPVAMGQVRTLRREVLFKDIEDGFIREKRGDAAKAHRDVYGKAFSLVSSPLGNVFNINTEKPALIAEYGNNNFGKGCLLARKLVEAGVACVEVDMGGWDLHAGIFPALKNQRLPMLDKGMGTLVRDLSDRGLLKNTVVLWMGEFGRTPRINQNGGRDHWARCWSVVVGGGGIKGGQVFGATDDDGTSVKGSDRATVGDLFATVYKGLGLDPALQVRDNLGRPLAISDGRPISQLL